MNSWKLLSALILTLALTNVGAFPQETDDMADENDEKRDISLVDETERSLNDDLVDDAVKETVRDILKATGKDDLAGGITRQRRILKSVGSVFSALLDILGVKKKRDVRGVDDDTTIEETNGDMHELARDVMSYHKGRWQRSRPEAMY